MIVIKTLSSISFFSVVPLLFGSASSAVPSCSDKLLRVYFKSQILSTWNLKSQNDTLREFLERNFPKTDRNRPDVFQIDLQRYQ